MDLRLSLGFSARSRAAAAAPATRNVTFGALTRSGIGGGVATAAGAIISGNGAGHFQVTGGYLCPTVAGDAANLNAGRYTLGLDNGDTFHIAVEEDCWSIATQPEWSVIIVQAEAVLAAKKLRVRALPSGHYVSGVIGGAGTPLRRMTLGGLVIAADDLADKPVFDRFHLEGVNGVTFQGIKTTAVAETKFQLVGQTSFHLYDIVIEQCEVSGEVADPYGDYTNSANYPNRNIDLITTQGSANNSLGTITVRDCIVEWGATCIGLRVDRSDADEFIVEGNLVRFFYDDGIGLTNATPTQATWYDCAARVKDNVVYGCLGRGNEDSDSPHSDGIRFISRPNAGADWTIYLETNLVYVGPARGNHHLQAVLASDMKSDGVDSGHFYKGWAIGNVVVTDSSVGLRIENAKELTQVNTLSLSIGAGSSDATSSGVHVVERNVAEAFAIGGSPALADNITLGKEGAFIPYTDAFAGVGPSWYPNTREDVLAWFAMKQGGALVLPGTPDVGAIGSGAVTFATASPGSDGAIAP
jgi:hypothetical protein